MTKTLRLLAADWQGGNKPEYYFGAGILFWCRTFILVSPKK